MATIIKPKTSSVAANVPDISDLADGEFAINIKSASDVIIFSSVGFVLQEVKVGSQSNINLTLADDVANLSEVIVTGYGTQSKRDITGAVSVVDAKELNTFAASSFTQKNP